MQDSIEKDTSVIENSQQQQQQITNGHARLQQQVPLTRCHLQRLDSRKSETMEECYKNGYCDVNNGFNNISKTFVKER